MPRRLYHPDAFEEKPSNRGGRKVEKRLRAMTDRYEFAGKRVLDLGCSEGFFSLRLAAFGADVIGVDGDDGAIRRSRAAANSQGISNARFLQGVITPEYVASEEVPSVNVTLFLSVLHHIMADSRRYDFNGALPSGLVQGVAILRAIRAKTEVLFFETGQSSEDHEWATRLPEMGSDPAGWISQHLLAPAGFENVETIPPAEWGGAKGALIQALYTKTPFLVRRSSGVFGRGVRRLTDYDTRDCRYLFMAR